jgi:thiol-disulfide isomerase/thioredoxin
VKRRGLLAGALAAPLAGCGPTPKSVARPPWPTLPVRDLAGRAATVAAEGRPQLVHFWALWCPPCRVELPALQRLGQALAPQGVALTALALGDDLFAVREYLGQNAPGLPAALVDPQLGLLRKPLAVDALPQTFVVGADGGIAICWVGARDWDAEPVRSELGRVLRPA